MPILLQTTEVFRIDTDEQARAFLEEQKQSNEYEITKYDSKKKTKKQKGDIVDEWYQLSITKVYNDV